MNDMIIAGAVALCATVGVVYLVEYIKARIQKSKEKWEAEYRSLDWYDED